MNFLIFVLKTAFMALFTILIYRLSRSKFILYLSFRRALSVLLGFIFIHFVFIATNIGIPIGLIYGPLLWAIYYSCFLESGNPRANTRYGLHFIPFFFFGAFYWFLYFFSRTIPSINAPYLSMRYYYPGYWLAMACSLLSYGLWGISRRPVIKQQRIRSYYLFRTFLIISLAVSLLLFLFVIKMQGKTELGFNVNSLIYSLLGLSGFIILVYMRFAAKDKHDYLHYQQTAQAMKAFLTRQPLYLDPNMTLSRLATEIAIPKHLCEKTIYAMGFKNIYHYLAFWRINYVKKLIQEDTSRKLKIEYFAQVSGFKSKASFNQHFRKITGYTPSQYRQIVHSNTRHEQAIF